MAQDLRELFKKEEHRERVKLSEGHEKRFEVRLDSNLKRRKNHTSFYWYKIAAILLVVLSIGYFVYDLSLSEKKETQFVDAVDETKPVGVKQEETIYLSEVSPAYKKVEDYYLAVIHTELAQLNITNENKALIDSFLAQLAELDKEYKRLNEELSNSGVSQHSVGILIENLRLRLNLLVKLKNKLKELKKSSLEQTKVGKI